MQIQEEGGQPHNIAIVSPMEKEPLESCQLAHDLLTSASAAHIQVLKPVERYKVEVVPLERILRKCIFIELMDKPGIVYACELSNILEQD